MGDYGEPGGGGAGGPTVVAQGNVYCEETSFVPGGGGVQQQRQQQRGPGGGGGRRGGRRSGGGAAGGGDGDSIVAPHPDFPTAKTLLIAFRRSRSFLERTARELLAGGTEYIMLSALGDAIPLAVQLQHALQAKKAALTLRIETVLVQSRGNAAASVAGGAAAAAAQGGGTTPAAGGGISPGLRIVMQRHPEFKGSRISPGYVVFMGQPEQGGETPAYEPEPTESCACVNVGAPDLCLGSGRRDVMSLLEREGFPVESLKLLHAQLLARALEESADKADADVKATVVTDSSDIPEAKDVHTSGALGSVFVTAFRDRFPHGEPNNGALVYVVAPRLSHFGGASDKYLDADDGDGRSLTIGSPQQQQALKAEIAKAILRGLDQGYRHGPSPRLSFADEDDMFRQAWIEATGLDPAQQAPTTTLRTSVQQQQQQQQEQ